MENEGCFLCEKEFKIGDHIAEFFGGFAHFKCFDNQMKENKFRNKIKEEDWNKAIGSDIE